MKEKNSALFLSPLLLGALMAVPACSRDADWIITGAEIISEGRTEHPRQNGLAIKDGKIVHRGRDLEAWKGPGTRQIDVSGKTLFPGIVDHHVHLLNVGAATVNQESGESLFLDLSAIRSFQELGERIVDRAASQPAGSWILGQGWSQANLGISALPGLEPISGPVPENPVFLTRVDGHAGWANREALRIAGINGSTPEPGGRILRDTDGKPTGVLLETANEPIARKLPPVDPDVLEQAFRTGASALAASGITEIYDAGFLCLPGIVSLEIDHARILDALLRADRKSPLPIEIHLMVPAPTDLWRRVVANPEHFRRLSPNVSVSHVKLFADGALGSRGGALSHDFHDDPGNRGVQRLSREELSALSREALGLGFDVATHAIGDAAVKAVLDVYQQVLAENPEVEPGRLRIEHFSYARSEDQVRAARLGVILSVQPNFVAPDNNGITMEDARLGPGSGIQRVYAWRTLYISGANLVFGSDYFSLPGPPLLNFFSAVTRQNMLGLPKEGWHPDQRLSRKEAMLLQATGCKPGGKSSVRSLSVGDSASFSILSANPLIVSEEEILKIRVHATFKNGRLVYHDGILAGLP